MVLLPSKMVLPPSKMVLPQAMAWVQYCFRVLSLKFCGKSKKNCGDISPQSPAFCMYELTHVLLFAPENSIRLNKVAIMAMSINQKLGVASYFHPLKTNTIFETQTQNETSVWNIQIGIGGHIENTQSIERAICSSSPRYQVVLATCKKTYLLLYQLKSKSLKYQIVF